MVFRPDSAGEDMNIVDLFRLSERMRLKCIDALHEVSDARFVEPIPGLGGHSLRDLLVHWIETEDYWVHTVVRNRKITPYRTADYATVRAACRKWDEVRRETFKCIESLSEADLSGSRTVQLEYSTEEMTVDAAFLWLYTHDAQTRGEFCARMLLLGFEEPDLEI